MWNTSKLGSRPAPFLIYIINYDIPNVSKKLYSILFADDTSVFLEGNNLNSLSTIINEELNKLSMWLASNKLTLNIDKSHYVIFHRARLKQNNINITLSNISLEGVTFTKFLGVISLMKNHLLQSISNILKIKKKHLSEVFNI